MANRDRTALALTAVLSFLRPLSALAAAKEAAAKKAALPDWVEKGGVYENGVLSAVGMGLSRAEASVQALAEFAAMRKFYGLAKEKEGKFGPISVSRKDLGVSDLFAELKCQGIEVRRWEDPEDGTQFLGLRMKAAD